MADIGTEHVLQREALEDLDLAGADLSGKELFDCTLRRIKAAESRWKGARLEDCVVEDCDLTRIDVTELRTFGVTFRRCKLMGVDWSTLAANPTLSFEECDLRYASFVGATLRKCLFRGCQARETSFVGCDLREADFGGTDLGGATFEDCDVSKADFATATGVLIDPAKNRVKGALVSAESAMLLAMLHGMRVAGCGDGRRTKKQ